MLKPISTATTAVWAWTLRAVKLTDPDEEQRADHRGQDDQQGDPQDLPHRSWMCVAAGSVQKAPSSWKGNFLLLLLTTAALEAGG